MITIQILGTGCPKCKKLAANAETAAHELQIEVKMEKITDINEIMRFGVMITPGFAVNGEVLSTGKVLSVDAIKEMLRKAHA